METVGTAPQTSANAQHPSLADLTVFSSISRIFEAARGLNITAYLGGGEDKANHVPEIVDTTPTDHDISVLELHPKGIPVPEILTEESNQPYGDNYEGDKPFLTPKQSGNINNFFTPTTSPRSPYGDHMTPLLITPKDRQVRRGKHVETTPTSAMNRSRMMPYNKPPAALLRKKLKADIAMLPQAAHSDGKKKRNLSESNTEEVSTSARDSFRADSSKNRTMF